MTDVAATVLKQNSEEIWACLGFSNLTDNDSVPDSRITHSQVAQFVLSGFMSAVMFDPINKWT